MLGPILVLFGLAALAALLPRRALRPGGWLSGAFVLGLSGAVAARLPLPAPAVETFAWAPSLGVELAFRMDGLAAAFVVIVTAIGGLVLIHATGYLRGDLRLGRFLGLLLFFIASMLGLVLSDGIVPLFVFWELTSLASWLLIGFDHERQEARAAAKTAVVVTGAGGVALLLGLLHYRAIGLDAGLGASESWRLSALAGIEARGHALYLPALLLVLAGAFTKSAQAPFHFWLPRAMVAPAPASALLHAAAMVKAGIYLLARLHPSLGGTPAWTAALGGAGAATMLAGAVFALGEKDMKRILAWATVAVLGILTMLLGLGSAIAIRALVVFLVAHALYKAALFLIAGNVEHMTGSRDVTAIRGLRRAMPLTAAAGILAALSQAGAPPLFGFFGKEMLFETRPDLATPSGWLILAAVTTNVLLVASAFLVGLRPFLGRRRAIPATAHEPSPSLSLGPVALAAASLVIAFSPGWFSRVLAEPMATAIAGRPVPMPLALWHGLSADALTHLALGGASLALGTLLFLRVRRGPGRLAALRGCLARFGPARAFDAAFEGFLRGAAAVTRTLHAAPLSRAVGVTAAALVIAGLPPLAAVLLEHGVPAAGPVLPWEAAAAAAMIAGAVLAAATRSPLTAVAGLGLTGAAIALLFLLFGAPDLAITQVMVETLMVILFVTVLYRLPVPAPAARRRIRVLDLGIALGAGLTVAVAMLAAATVPAGKGAGAWMAAESLPRGFGRNVVNVILVDFRALDTLGEATAIALAGIGILALVRGARRGPEARR